MIEAGYEVGCGGWVLWVWKGDEGGGDEGGGDVMGMRGEGGRGGRVRGGG